MSLFVIYGFDTASTLAEETRDPRRAAPKAVLFSVVGAFIIGGVFLLGDLMAIPNLHTAISGNGGLGWSPANVIEANFSPPFATIYLLVVSAAIFVCCLSIMAATIRLCFGMSRDNQLPLSRHLSKVAPGLHTPIWACIAIAILAAVPFIQYSGAGIIAIAATGMIYLSYFLGQPGHHAGQAARLAEDQGTVPARPLGPGGERHRPALRRGDAGQLRLAEGRQQPRRPSRAACCDFHVGFLNGIPILWTVLVVIVLIGALYYGIAGRRKEFAPVTAPAQDDPPVAEVLR